MWEQEKNMENKQIQLNTQWKKEKNPQNNQKNWMTLTKRTPQIQLKCASGKNNVKDT